MSSARMYIEREMAIKDWTVEENTVKQATRVWTETVFFFVLNTWPVIVVRSLPTFSLSQSREVELCERTEALKKEGSGFVYVYMYLNVL